MTSKIHRATVTQADLDYVGSITVDIDLLEAADLLPGERVDICNCTNGNRLSTYVIPGERGAGEICINGAAAHLVSPGDVVILIAYSQMSDAEARTYLPRVVFVDEANRIVERGTDPGQIPADSDVARLQGLRPTGIPLAEAPRLTAPRLSRVRSRRGPGSRLVPGRVLRVRAPQPEGRGSRDRGRRRAHLDLTGGTAARCDQDRMWIGHRRGPGAAGEGGRR